MSMIKDYIFKRKGVVINTVIGGVGASITTTSALASTLNLDVSRIDGFKIKNNDIYCRIEGSYAMPTACFDGNSDITFYDDSLEGKVLSLGIYNFRNCTNLLTISVPNVSTINFDAFRGCNSLHTFDSLNLTSISNYGFLNCSSLVNVNLTKVTSLGASSLEGCNSLVDGNFASLLTTGSGSFKNCNGFTSISCPVLETIGASCFYGTSNLLSITSPNVTYLGPQSFYNSGITSLSLPNVTQMQSLSLYTVPNLLTVDLPSVTSIVGTSVFDNSKKITSIYMPNLSGNLPTKTFFNCNALQTTGINYNNITSVGSQVFDGCHSLNEDIMLINIPTITYRLFCNCYAIPKIHLSSATLIDGNNVFDKCYALIDLDISNVNSITSTTAIFYNSGITYLNLPLITSVNNTLLNYLPNIVTINIPLLASIGNTVEYDNAFYLIKTGATLNVASSMATSNGGGVEGDLQNIITTRGAIVNYI